MKNESMLELKNLHVAVDGNEILKGIDLSVKPGEVHAIMGPNGSGKSTLASVLAGREDYEITEPARSATTARTCSSWMPRPAPARASFWPFSTRWRSPASATPTFCVRR